MLYYNMVKSYSQEAQDLKVLLHYKLKENGYFVEVGAADGIRFSNTLLLERKYNWYGICVEPDEDEYGELLQNRDCHCSSDAVYSTSGKELEFSICKNNLFSGLSEHMRSDIIDSVKGKVKVRTITLIDLLNKFDAPSFIEYLSLDTEGSEYEILRVFDFSKYKFGLIHVEHNYEEPKRTLIKELLLQNGYKYMGEYKWDDFYCL